MIKEEFQYYIPQRINWVEYEKFHIPQKQNKNPLQENK